MRPKYKVGEKVFVNYPSCFFATIINIEIIGTQPAPSRYLSYVSFYYRAVDKFGSTFSVAEKSILFGQLKFLENAT